MITKFIEVNCIVVQDASVVNITFRNVNSLHVINMSALTNTREFRLGGLWMNRKSNF